MSLPNYEKKPISEQMNQSFQEMEHQLANLSLLAQDEEAAAQKVKEINLLLMTVTKFGQIQQAFLKSTVAVLNEQNRHQMKLLNVQSEYAESIREDVGKTVTAMYEQFREEQNKAFSAAHSDLINCNKRMLDKLGAAANETRKAADYANATAERIRCIEDWKELLFYLSPAVVIADIVIRLIIFFCG